MARNLLAYQANVSFRETPEMRKILFFMMSAMAVLGSAQAESGLTAAPAPQSIECVAAFELMNRAAPNWTRQTNVQIAWQGWQGQATRLARSTDVDYGTQINRAMTTLADQLTLDPNLLSRRVMQCVADIPNR